MKIAFCTLGCKLNFAESSAIGKALLGLGHVRAKQGEAADVVVLNTCSVTDAADHKGRQAIHRLRRQHPQAVLIVTGCYAELKGQEIGAMPEVDYVLGANEKERVVEIIKGLDEGLRIKDKRQNSVLDEGLRIKDERRNSTDSEISASKVHTAGETPASPVALQHGAAWRPHLLEGDTRQTSFFPACSWDDRTRCFLKVQDGCNYFCTYCTIPLARGRSRNASIADIVAQAEQALRDGAREIVLTGVNIGDFGRSTGERFIDLLRALDELGTLPNPPYKGGSRENSSDSETSETKVISPSSCVLHPSSENAFATRWFEAVLSQAEAEVADLFGKYRLSEALMAIYKLYTDEFSGWYLEMIKPAYGQPIDRTTYEATCRFLDRMLRLLHPFMPFITEELWQNLTERKEGESIMKDEGVRIKDERLISTDSENADTTVISPSSCVLHPVSEEGELLKALVSNIRNIRASKNISPKEVLTLVAPEAVNPLVCKLANVEVTVGAEKSAQSSSFIIGTTEYSIPLDKFINVDAEREKLEADLAHQRGFLAGVMKKLSNERFVQNAKPEVVALERKKQADAEARIATLEAALEALKK